MTYDQILTLDAIVKYGSFKAASEVLHKTQPSLSMAIKKCRNRVSNESEKRYKETILCCKNIFFPLGGYFEALVEYSPVVGRSVGNKLFFQTYLYRITHYNNIYFLKEKNLTRLKERL